MPMNPRGHGPQRTPSALSMQFTPGKHGDGEHVSRGGFPVRERTSIRCFFFRCCARFVSQPNCLIYFAFPSAQWSNKRERKSGCSHALRISIVCQLVLYLRRVVKYTTVCFYCLKRLVRELSNWLGGLGEKERRVKNDVISRMSLKKLTWFAGFTVLQGVPQLASLLPLHNK